MKISILIVGLLLLLSPAGLHAQGLIPSTVRQVFSLEKGDSLMYHVWTRAQICLVSCESYKLRVVDTLYSNSNNDSVFIKFHTQDLYFYQNAGYQCGACDNYIDGLVAKPAKNDSLWAITNLNRSIIDVDTINYGRSFDDSIVSDSSIYNGLKQNITVWSMNIMGYGIDNFGDSLGVVYHHVIGSEAPDDENEQLIYYHKANGSSWGTPYISTGIENVSDEYMASVYPNPSQDRFVVKAEIYPGVRIELYDILSKKVISQELTGKETEVNSSGLAPGIYYWNLKNENHLIKSGKLIME